MAKDAAWTIAGQLFVMLGLLAVNKVVSNCFSVGEFGIYSIMRNSSSVLTFVMLGGLGITLPRYIALYTGKNERAKCYPFGAAAVAYFCATTFAVCAVVLLLYRSMAVTLVGSKSISSLAVVLLYSLSVAVSTFLYSVFRGTGDFKSYTLTQVAFSALTLVPLVFAAELGIDELYLFWALLSFALSLALSVYIMRKAGLVNFKNVKPRAFKKSFSELSKYSLPRLAGDFFLFAMTAFPVLYMGRFCSLETVSLFSVGIFFEKMGQPLFSFLGVILLPYVSKNYANNRLSQCDGTIRKILLVEMVLAVLLVSVLLVFMPLWIKLFFSESYAAALGSARVLVLALLPAVVYLLYRNPIDAVSVFPYNTVIMLVSFGLMVAGFCLAKTEMQYAWAFFGAVSFRGVASLCCWNLLKKKAEKNT